MSFSPTYPSAVEVPFGVLQQITQMNDNFISKEMSWYAVEEGKLASLSINLSTSFLQATFL